MPVFGRGLAEFFLKNAVEKASVGQFQLIYDPGNTQVCFHQQALCFPQHNILTVLGKGFSGALFDDAVQVFVIIVKH